MIVTELCEQHSLRNFLTKFKGKAPINIRLRIVFDIAKALLYIHRRTPRVIHRDIKPENILLTSDLKAKIADFGYIFILMYSISKESIIDESAFSTPTGGTLSYMAPESITKSLYLPESDIYGFAICAFELIYERQPWGGLGTEDRTDFMLIEAISKGQNPFSCNPDMIREFPNLDNLLTRCWDSDYRNRPSASDICATIDKEIEALKGALHNIIDIG